MTTAPEQILTTSATTSSSVTTFTTTAIIPVGRLIVIGLDRSSTASTINGIASVAVSTGAIGTLNKSASANRASTHDLAIVAALVTTQISSGSTVTITSNSTAAKRGGVLAVFPSVSTSVAETSSGNTADGGAGNVSAGPNGSGTTATATATSTTTTADSLLIGGASYGGTTNTTEGSGWTLIAKIKTTSGTGDRGILLEYISATTTGTKSATATYDATSGWAAAIATYPLVADPPPSSGSAVVIGGVKKTIASESVVIGGVKKTVANKWVVIGGVKKTV